MSATTRIAEGHAPSDAIAVTEAVAQPRGVVTRVLLPMFRATVAGVFAFLCLNGGVTPGGYPGVIVAVVVCSAIVGSVASDTLAAILAAFVVFGVGGFVVTPWFIGGDLVAATVMLAAGVVGAGIISFAVDRIRIARAVVALIAVASVVVGVWAVGVHGATTAVMSKAPVAKLAERPVPGESWGDGEFYRAVVFKMRDGVPFYTAFAQSYAEPSNWKYPAPFGVLSVRPPAPFWLWAAVPGFPAGVVWALLALVSIACVACLGVASASTEPALAAAGAAAIGAYAVNLAMSPGDLFFVESWTGMLAVVSAGLFASSIAFPRRERSATIGAVAVAVFAAISRELMVFVLVAGLLAAMFARGDSRRFQLAAWGSGLGVTAIFTAIHWWFARGIVIPQADTAGLWLARRGVENLAAALRYSSTFASTAWLPMLIAALAVLGALLQPDVRLRAFALFVTVSPMVLFLVVGNAAVDIKTGTAVNYWGGIVVPLLCAFAPTAMRALGVRSRPEVPSERVPRLSEPATR